MAQRQRVRRSPRDAALALDPLDIANQQQAKIPPRRQRRPPHRLGVETLALPLHERVEPALLQHLVQALIERMRHCPRQLAVFPYTRNMVSRLVCRSTSLTRLLGETSLSSPPRFFAEINSPTRIPNPPLSM